jgi:DNA-binding transcriptional MerR regulator
LTLYALPAILGCVNQTVPTVESIGSTEETEKQKRGEALSMPDPKPPRSHPANAGLRMKHLVQATGVPKSTILYYLQQGLLPEPIKTSPNMAYYDPGCIDRIRFIQHLQRRHRLALAEIKQMLDLTRRNDDLALRLELNDIIFGRSQPADSLDIKGFCRETALDAKHVRALLDAKLLLPLEKNRFDREDVNLGSMYAGALAAGVKIADLTYYVELGEKIVDHEMALRRRLTHHLPEAEDAAMTIEMVKNARMSRAYIIDRLFQHRVASMQDLKDEEKSE